MNLSSLTALFPYILILIESFIDSKWLAVKLSLEKINNLMIDTLLDTRVYQDGEIDFSKTIALIFQLKQNETKTTASSIPAWSPTAVLTGPFHA